MKIAFLGHFTEDFIKTNDSEFSNIGGGVTYGGLCAKNYENNEYYLVSSASENFLKKLDEFFGINLIINKCECTTTFFLDYTKPIREVSLIKKANDLCVKDVPKRMDAYIVSSVCNEASVELISEIFSQNQDSLIAIDAQGFIRDFDSSGKANLKVNEKLNLLFSKIKGKFIFKASDYELKAITGCEDIAAGMKKLSGHGSIIITTFGEKGSIILAGNEFINIPAFLPEKVVDETGAGDTYLSTFVIEYLKSKNLKQSGLCASMQCSNLISEKGPKGFKSRDEILSKIKSVPEGI